MIGEEFEANEFAVDVLCDENGFVALPFRRLEEEGITVNWGDGEPEILKGSSLFLAEHRYDVPKTWHRIIVSCSDWSKVWMAAYKSEKHILDSIAPQNPVYKGRSCTWRFLTPLPAIAGVLVHDWTNPVQDADGQFIFREYDIADVKDSLEYAMCFFGKIEELPPDLFINIKSRSFEGTFKGCTIKCIVLHDLFSGQNEAESFASCFEEVDFTESRPIHDGIFVDCIEAKDFSKLFKNSTLEYVPENLFNGCREALTYRSCFYGTKIKRLPRKPLFDSSPKAENFTSCFGHCKELEVANEGLFNGTNGKSFSWCFSECTKLDIVRTPFAGCTNAESFYGCFNECTSLMAIDGSIFMDAKKATDFGSCFSGCENIHTIPDTLFSYAYAAEDFDSVFRGCRSIASVPKGLFSKCSNAMHFGGAFSECISLERVDDDVFRGCTKAETFEACFLGCIELNLVPMNLFSWCRSAATFKRCFEGCLNLVDYLRLAIFSIWVEDAEGFISRNASFADGCGTIVAVPAGSRTERAFRNEERENASLKISSIHLEW